MPSGANNQFPIAFFTLNYNPAGRVQWEFKGPLPHPYTPPGRTNTFDADNRLSTFNGTAVTVDADGNLTYGPLTNNTFGTYTYDARNELTSVGGIGYGYDPSGNRTSMTNGTNVAVYVIDPKTSQVLMRIKNAVTNYYVYGNGLLYESDETATTTTTAFYHYDCRGSTVTLTDGNGNPTDVIEYSPYGTTTYRAGTNDTPFLYNGQFGVQTDPNGLLYMRARYYNPYISRFLNSDPSRFGGGLNFYAYCNDNPISNSDPFGLYVGLDDLAFAAGGAVLGAAGQGVADLVSWKWMGWSGIGRAAAAGAAGGEASLYGTPIVGAAVFAATKNTLDQSAEMAQTGNSFNYGQLGGQTVVGGLTGAVGEFIPMPTISGLNAGRGSFDAVTAQMVTKLENGTIQNISLNTAGKMFVSQTYNGLPEASLDGVMTGMQNNVFGNSGSASTSSPTGKPSN